MTAGGTVGLTPGQWTDDTSLALGLAESLIETNGFDLVDQLECYVRWYRHGHLSSTGECFGIGNTTAKVLHTSLHGTRTVALPPPLPQGMGR